MKRGLKINYSNLDGIIDLLNDYIQGTEDMASAIKSIDALLDSSSGDSVDALKESGISVVGKLDDFKGYLAKVRDLIGDYIRDMTAISQPLVFASMTRADRNDIYWNIEQISWARGPGKGIYRARWLQLGRRTDQDPEDLR